MAEADIDGASRICGSCSKCCEGWLQGSAHGKKFWRGRPCHYFVGSQCSIYGNHPEDPCKLFKCEWLSNGSVPGWMRPDQVNTILVTREKNGLRYLEVNEAGQKLQAEVLSWAIMYCLQQNLNIVYYIDGGVNRIGSKEFLNLEL
jgi:hypothetical protein